MENWLTNFVRRLVSILLLSLLILSAFGCNKDEPVTPTPKPVEEEHPKQYGEPFTNVPDTRDINMYEVNIRVFSEDGDLDGVTARLDEIKDLGINVIWLMPIYEPGVLKSVGSPYAIKDYKKVNPEFGTLEDLRELVSEAHDRDMAVILDWVANHTSWDHKWIQNVSWYTRDDSGNIVQPEGTNWTDVADLNFGSLAMRKEMISAMKYWVLEANVDGFRCDYADGVPTDFWKQAIDTLRSIPDRKLVMFAEGGKKELFSSGFDLIFGWNFYGKLKDLYEAKGAVATLFNAHTTDYSSVGQGKHILRWITNHDDNAWDDTPTTIFGGVDGSISAFVITVYMGGVPLIYNGQEVAYPVKLPFFSNTSTRIDWSLNPGVLATYKNLLAVRNSSDALRGGEMENHSTADVVAFTRISGSDQVLVVVNVRNGARTFAVPVELRMEWEDAVSGEPVTLDETIELEPYAYRIFRK